MVNTVGLSKPAVLAALYNASKPQGLGFLQYDPAPMTEEDAAKILTASPGSYFDYLKGRVMKVDLRDDTGFEEWLYDRDNGEGAAQRAIEKLRASKKEEQKNRSVPTVHSLSALTSELVDRGYKVWTNQVNGVSLELKVEKNGLWMKQTIALEEVLNEGNRSFRYTSVLEEIERHFGEML